MWDALGAIILYLVFRFRLVVSHSSTRVALLGCEVLSVFEQDSLELGFAVHVKQLLSKVHVRKYGGKRATRFKRILGAFLWGANKRTAN